MLDRIWIEGYRLKDIGQRMMVEGCRMRAMMIAAKKL